MSMPDLLHNDANFRRASPSSQQGVALVVALILLVVITLVGLASVSGTIMENKAASNQFDRQIAYQAAAAALRAGEDAVVTATQAGTAPGAYRDCSAEAGNQCLANPFNGDLATITHVSTVAFDAGSLAAMQPQYVIQYLGKFRAKALGAQAGAGGVDYVDAYFYRITARSGDPAAIGSRSVVTLQSTFRD